MSLIYKNVLVGIDGSTEAESALNKAIDIAKRNEANLVIAHVIDTTSFAITETYGTSTVIESAKAYAKQLLEKYKEQAENAGINNVQIVAEYGSPKAIMVKTLPKQYAIDLIVCGAVGMNAIERFLIGSVSSYITRHASCDVMVVRNTKE